jgi:hypothetical protein
VLRARTFDLSASPFSIEIARSQFCGTPRP